MAIFFIDRCRLMRMHASKDRHDVRKLQWRRSAGRLLCWKISLFLHQQPDQGDSAPLTQIQSRSKVRNAITAMVGCSVTSKKWNRHDRVRGRLSLARAAADVGNAFQSARPCRPAQRRLEAPSVSRTLFEDGRSVALF